MHTLGTCCVASRGHPKLPLSPSVSPYSIPTRLAPRNDLKCLQRTRGAQRRIKGANDRGFCVRACPLLTLQKVLLSPFSWDEARGLPWEKGLGFIKNSRLHFLRTENMGCFSWEVGGRLGGINPKDWAFFLMSCREGMEWMFWFGWRVG